MEVARCFAHHLEKTFRMVVDGIQRHGPFALVEPDAWLGVGIGWWLDHLAGTRPVLVAGRCGIVIFGGGAGVGHQFVRDEPRH